MTRMEILSQYYVTQTDIQKLLQMTHKKAKKIYEMVSEMENQELGEFRAHDNKDSTEKSAEVSENRLQLSGSAVPTGRTKKGTLGQLGGNREFKMILSL